MQIAAVTPLKLTSTRLPKKNFLDLSGSPLCWWALRTVLNLVDSGDVCGVWAFGESVIEQMLPDGVTLIDEGKPPEYQDGNQLFAQIASLFPECSHLLLFNCTAPFVRPETYRRGVEAVRSGACDSAFSAVALRGRFWRDGTPVYHVPNRCPPTQSEIPLLMESEAFWIVPRSVLVEETRRVGHNAKPIIVTGAEAVDINTPQDMEFARYVARGLECGLH